MPRSVPPSVLLDEMLAILRHTSWTPAQRVAYALLRAEAEQAPISEKWLLADGSAKGVAALVGVSARSAQEITRQLAGAGVLERRVGKGVRYVNRHGEEIPTAIALRHGSPERGDRRMFDADTELALPAALPALPDHLPRSVNTERSRTTAAAARAKFSELEQQVTALLAGAACPSCGEGGTLQGEVGAVCTGCGVRLDSTELDALFGHPPEQPAQTLRDYADGTGCPFTPPPARGSTAWAWQQHGEQFAEDARRRCRTGADYATAWDAFVQAAERANFAEPELEPEPIPEHANFAEPERALEVHSAQNLHDISSLERANSAYSAEPEEGHGVGGAGAVTLRGADTVRFLAAMGVSTFTKAYAPGTRLPSGAPATGKEGLGARYLDGCSAADAIAWLERGGNVGIACRGLAVWDADDGLQALLEVAPELAGVARVHRSDAPQRGKVITVCGSAKFAQLKDGARGIRGELLAGERHAIVAGRHQSGAEIILTPGQVPELEPEKVTELLERVNGAAQPAPVAQSLPTASGSAPGSGSLISAAIAWWNEQPANIAEVERLLSERPRRGSNIALRADDEQPSARATRRGDALFDYARAKVSDRYEIWCELTNTDKHTDVWRVVNEYRVAHGKRPLRLRH